MEYNSHLQKWDDDDVMSFNDSMFKVGKFRDAVNFAFTDTRGIKDGLSNGFYQKGVGISASKLLDEGEDCEVLKLGAKGWQKGKIRIKVTVEFCPDEPDVEETPISNHPEINQIESPLDDIRQMMNGNS